MTSSLSNVTLAILAGGEGSRMGKPKGHLEIAGKPILAYLLDQIGWPGPTMLVTAIVKQIIGVASDASYRYAGIANGRMLGAPRYNGVLPGPRSPDFGKPMPAP